MRRSAWRRTRLGRAASQSVARFAALPLKGSRPPGRVPRLGLASGGWLVGAGGRAGHVCGPAGRTVPTTSSRSATAPRATAPMTPRPSGVHTSPEKLPAVVIASLAAPLARPVALLARSVAPDVSAFSSMEDRSIPADERACGAWAGGVGYAGA